jgi:protoporphyrinogen IX oxidase
MLWVLVLHIVAVLFWAAGLLYLPLLLAAAGAGTGRATLARLPEHHDSVGRFVFTHIATPAALLAIITGTGVFLIDRTVEFWLIVKLTVVAALVLAHVMAGLLVLRVEGADTEPRRVGLFALVGVLALLMVTIVWIVLAKPVVPEALQWAT